MYLVVPVAGEILDSVPLPLTAESLFSAAAAADDDEGQQRAIETVVDHLDQTHWTTEWMASASLWCDLRVLPAPSATVHLLSLSDLRSRVAARLVKRHLADLGHVGWVEPVYGVPPMPLDSRARVLAVENYAGVLFTMCFLRLAGKSLILCVTGLPPLLSALTVLVAALARVPVWPVCGWAEAGASSIFHGQLDDAERQALRAWLIEQQSPTPHVFRRWEPILYLRDAQTLALPVVRAFVGMTGLAPDEADL